MVTHTHTHTKKKTMKQSKVEKYVKAGSLLTSQALALEWRKNQHLTTQIEKTKWRSKGGRRGVGNTNRTTPLQQMQNRDLTLTSSMKYN